MNQHQLFAFHHQQLKCAISRYAGKDIYIYIYTYHYISIKELVPPRSLTARPPKKWWLEDYFPNDWERNCSGAN